MGCWVNKFVLVSLIFLTLFTLNVFAACVPFNTYCKSDNNPYVCSWTGLSETKLDTCSSSQACYDPFGTSYGAQCMNLKCDTSGTNGDVYYYTEGGSKTDRYEDCGSGESCSGGSCLEWLCTPNSKTCTSSTVLKTCSADGLSSTSSNCSSGKICSDGACITDCSPTTYSTSCYNDDVYYYDKCGVRQSKKTECGDDSVGSAYCSGRKIYKDSVDRGCSSASCFSNTTPVLQSTCADYQYCSSASCSNGSISSVSWSKSTAWESDIVTLTANVSNIADGVKIKFYIFEDDLIFNDELDTVYANVSSGKASVNWTIPNLDDGWGAPEIKFTASVDVYTSINKTSVKLPVSQQCSGTTNNKRCNSLGTGVEQEYYNANCTTYWSAVQTCGTYQKCSTGSCVDKSCQDMGYLDSCILLSNTICSSNNPFKCQTTPSTKWCYVKTDTCASDEICKDPWNLDPAQCVCNPTDLTDTYKCNTPGEGGDVYWYDNCGGIREKKSDGECGATSESAAYCSGRNILKDYVGRGCSSTTNSCYSTPSTVTLQTCADYKYCSSGSCSNGSISSVSWSKPAALEGDLVTLTANVSNIADGVKIKFYIFEDDLIFNDDLNILYANVSSGKATINYVIPNLDDGWAAPEIKFTASVDVYTSINKTSVKLPVAQQCSGTTNNKRCGANGQVEQEFFNANCTTYWSAVQTCSSFEKCSNGACVNKTCEEQGYLSSCTLLTNTICSSNNPYKCQVAPNTGNWCYIKTETCGTGEYCNDPLSPFVGAQCFTLGCFDNDVYYYFKTDGSKSERKEECPSYSGCVNSSCADGSIESATWSKTLVTVGDSVKMTASFIGVEDGTKVNFKVLEYDIWRSQSIGIEAQAEIIGGVAEATITVPAISDLISNAEIKFNVFITDKPSITKTSELLKIYYDPKISIDLYDEQIQTGYIGQVLWSVSSSDENETGIDFGNSTSRLCYPLETEYSNCYKRFPGVLLEENIYFGLVHPKDKGKMYLRAYANMDSGRTIYSDWKSLDIYDDTSSKIGLWFKKIDLEDIMDGGVELAKVLTFQNCIDNSLWSWGCGLDVLLILPIGKVIKSGQAVIKLSKSADVITSIENLEDFAKYSFELKMKGSTYAKAGGELLEAHNLKILNIDKVGGVLSTQFDNLAEYVIKNSITSPKNLLTKGLLKEELENFILKGIDLKKVETVLLDSKWVTNNQEAVTVLRGITESKGSSALKEAVENWDTIATIQRKTPAGKYPDLYLKSIGGKELTLEAKGILNPLSSNQKLLEVLDECGEQLSTAWGEKIAVISLKQNPVLTSNQINDIVVAWMNNPVTWGPGVNKVVIEMPSGATQLIERTIFSKNEIIGATLIAGIFVLGPSQVSAIEITEVPLQTCTSFTYSDWNNICIEGMQYRKISSSTPFGCIDGSPVLSKSCNITCSTNSQCGLNDWVLGTNSCSNNDVYQNFRTYTCNNPGTTSSSCSNAVAFNLKADCGNTTYTNWSANYCNGNNVEKSRTVNNKGCSSGACTASTTSETQIVQTCLSGCNAGSCNVACSSDVQCGTNNWLNKNYCSSNDIWDVFRTYTCSNPGTINATCSYIDSNQVKSICTSNQYCSNGTCLPKQCTSGACCDTNGLFKKATQVCKSKALVQNYCSGSEAVSKTFDQFCSGSSSICDGNLIEVSGHSRSCSSSEICSNGVCLLKQCTSGACCDTNGFFKPNSTICESNILGAKSCSENKVVQQLGQKVCSGVSASCDSNTIWNGFIDVNVCATNYLCNNAQCVLPTCSNNSQCNDNNSLTNDVCLNSGTIQSVCQYTPVPIICSNNIQCGTNGWVASNYCNVNNIWGTYRTYTCNNPGLINSNCSSLDINQIKSVCSSSQTCLGGVCVDNCVPNWTCSDWNSCLNDSQYRTCNDNCGNQRTESQTCTSSEFVTFRASDLAYNGKTAVAVSFSCGGELVAYGGTTGACSEYNCATSTAQFMVPNDSGGKFKAWVRSSGNDVCICNGSTLPKKFNINDFDKEKVSTESVSIDSTKEISCDYVPVAECSSGACCDSLGFYKSEEEICGVELEGNKYCEGPAVMQERYDQTCSGNSSSCNGTKINFFTIPLKICESNQTCLNGACIDKEQCNPLDPCCNDLGEYENAGTICQENALIEKRCNNDSVEQRNISFTCTGNSSSCTGESTQADSWFVSNQCTSSQICLNNSCVTQSCVPEWSCSNWKSCRNGISKRTCRDLKNCNDTSSKPVTSQECKICVDSDRGKVPKKFGITTGVFDGANPIDYSTREDYCVSSKVVREHLCYTNLIARYVDVTCARSCVDGRCI